MKVLVLWADSQSANLGVRVLAEGAESIAKQVWGPDSQVVCQDFTGAVSGIPLGGRSLLKDIFQPVGRIKPYLRSFDVVLDTGAGDSFSDIYGLKRLLVMTYVQWLCFREGVPIILLPQTIGPFRTPAGKSVARRTLKRARLVISRDSASAEVASNLTQTRVNSSSDLVFALPLKLEQLPSRFDVLLNVSGLLWNDNPHVDHLEYRSHVINLIQTLEESGRSVCLFPHVLQNESLDNDQLILGDIAARLDSTTSIIVPKSLSEARELVLSANLVIASRMHACLNALSVGTPSIPWAYSRKFEPLLNDLGWPHVIDLRKSSDPVRETLQMIDVHGADLQKIANEISIRGRDHVARTVSAIRDLKI